MLYFDRIDVSEGIAVNKTSALEECDIFHYWYFLNYILTNLVLKQSFNQTSAISVMIY